jgi:hypothetical protein
LIRVILALDGQRADTEDVREYQKGQLGRSVGRSDGHNAILDLSQLSSPSTGDWKVHDCGISWLRTREAYETRMLRPRCDSIKEKHAHHKPRLVLFFSFSHQYWWEQIAGKQFEPSGLPLLKWTQGETSLFAMMPHPNIRLRGKGAR